jgi:hypothetical protein
MNNGHLFMPYETIFPSRSIRYSSLRLFHQCPLNAPPMPMPPMITNQCPPMPHQCPPRMGFRDKVPFLIVGIKVKFATQYTPSCYPSSRLTWANRTNWDFGIVRLCILTILALSWGQMPPRFIVIEKEAVLTPLTSHFSPFIIVKSPEYKNTSL